MEPFEVTCPHCDKSLRVADVALLGRKVKCPKCKERLIIPSVEEMEAAGHVLEPDHAGVGSGVGGGSNPSFSGIIAGHRPRHDSQEDTAEYEPMPGDFTTSEYASGDYSSSRYPAVGRRKDEFPWQKFMTLIVIPASLLLFGTLGILIYKGVLFGPTDRRQDATRFTDFARDAEKQGWNPQPDHRIPPGKRRQQQSSSY